jgi:hypothetical protein
MKLYFKGKQLVKTMAFHARQKYQKLNLISSSNTNIKLEQYYHKFKAEYQVHLNCRCAELCINFKKVQRLQVMASHDN